MVDQDPETDEPTGPSRLRQLAKLSGSAGENAIAILNGLFGDGLDDSGSRLATPMSLRVGGSTLEIDRDTPIAALAAVVPTASPRICIMVHGLMSTESIWRLSETEPSYGAMLSTDHELTVLSLRYNTGRRISQNGRELAHLMQYLLRAWPVPVTEINLIAHSMGGLVVRSALHYAPAVQPRGRRLWIGRRWTHRVRRVVLIAVPNDGAGLEAFANRATAVLSAVPLLPSRLLGWGLEKRSVGIKDLRFGAIHDEDWMEQDPGTFERINPHRSLRLPRARHLLISGTVTDDPDHRVARVLGDALVLPASATGSVAGGPLFPGAEERTFPGLSHNALAHHRDVHGEIAAWWRSS